MRPTEYRNPFSAPAFGLKIHFHISAVTTADMAHGSRIKVRTIARCGICSLATSAMINAISRTPMVDQNVKSSVTPRDGRKRSLLRTSR